MSADLKHNMEDGMQTSFNLKTPYEMLEEVSIDFNHVPRQDGYDLSLVVKTPFEDFEQQSLTVTHNKEGSKKFTNDVRVEWLRETHYVTLNTEYEYKNEKIVLAAKLESSLPNYETIMDIQLKHTYLERGFSTLVALETPWCEKSEVEVVYRGERTNFESSLRLDYAEDRYETECTFQWEEDNKVVIWKLVQSPWTIRNLEVTITHMSAYSANTGTLGLKLNNNEKLDLDFSYTKDLPRNVRITVRKPMPMELIANYNVEGAKKIADITLKYVGKTLTADYERVSNSGWYTVDEKLIINVLLPSGRPLKLDTMVSVGDSTFKHEGLLLWDTNKQGEWSMELTKTEHRNQISYDGMMKVESPLVTKDFTVSHVITDHKQYTTTVTMQRGVFTHEVIIDDITFSHMVELQHPRLGRGLKHETILVVDPANCNVDFKVMLMMEDDNALLHTQLYEEQCGGETFVYKQLLKNSLTGLDVDISSIYKHNDQELSCITEVQWIGSKQDEMTQHKHEMVYNKDTSEIRMLVKNPEPLGEIIMTGRIKRNDDDHYVYEFIRTCGERTMALEMGVEMKTAFIELRHKPTPSSQEDKIRLQFEVRDLKNMDLKLVHSIQGQREVEDINVGIVDSRRGSTISTRTFFRENMMMDLADYLDTIDFSTELRNLELWMNMRMRHFEQIKMSQMELKDRIMTSLGKVFGEQLRYLQDSIDRMIEANDFYLGDISNLVQVGKDLVLRQMERLITYLSNTAEYYKTRSTRIMRGIITKLNVIVNKMNVYIEKMIEDYLPQIQDIHAVFERVVTVIDEAVTAINNHPLVKYYYTLLEKIETGEFMQGLKEWKMEVDMWVEELMETYEMQIAIIRDIWLNIKRIPVMRNLQQIIERGYEHYTDFSYNYDIEGTMKMIAHKLSKLSWQTLKSKMCDLMSESIRSWDPNNLNLEMDLYVPTEFIWDMRSGVQDFMMVDHLQNMLIWIKDLLPSLDWTFWDYYYFYSLPSSPSALLPPFKSWATLAGTQHFMTFDKKFYEFEGECSYLLARDFIDRKFAVVVKYDRARGELKKSIIVSDGDKQVNILPTGEVMVDGSNAELPLLMDATVVLREGSMMVIKNQHGVNVVCDLMYDRCTVEVTGWYYGKTAGLLGTYDNEPVNDMIKIDGSIASDLEDFTSSWAVGSCRRNRNSAVVQELDSSTPEYKECEKLFIDDSSVFRSGFKIVDPMDFMRMCVNDLASGSRSAEMTVPVYCKTGAFYVEECNRNGVPIRLPIECVKCENKGVEYEGEITVEGDAVPKSADVIFVIQHADCNRAVIENLRDVVEDLETVMATQGLTDNRFGIVGYGSEGLLNEPHSHTMDGQLFNTRQKFVQGIASWEDMQMGEQVVDTLKAVEFAAKYPFRTGVSKTIIVIPCESCGEVDISYRTVSKILKNRDIRMHVVMDHEFAMKGDVDKGPQRYGADRYGMFTSKHVKGSIESDRELYHQVKMPGDLCSSLSHVSSGAVFDVNKFTQASKNSQKKFAQVMVKVIADRAQPSECQYCECVADITGVSMSICRSCSNSYTFDYGLYPDILKFTDGSLLDLYSGY